MYALAEKKYGSSKGRVTYINDRKVRSMQEAVFDEHLRNAIQSGALSVVYQPQVDITNGNCDHFEALLRWDDPALGPVSPATFIPIAEELGMMNQLTKFVIDRVVSDIADWRANNVLVGSIAINISAKHLADEDDAALLLSWLYEAAHVKDFLSLELTETAMLSNKTIAIRYMREISDLGFRIALDDFGTGYSSLAYLLEFPIHTIKVERSFTSSITHSSKCQTILRWLLSLAKTLELGVVVEGVETHDEIMLLKKWGGTLAQGYYFSRPLSKDDIESFVSNSSILEGVGTLSVNRL